MQKAEKQITKQAKPSKWLGCFQAVKKMAYKKHTQNKTER